MPAFERAIFFVVIEKDATVEPWQDEWTGNPLFSSLPAFERAIFFVVIEKDATVEPWHDEKGEFRRH